MPAINDAMTSDIHRKFLEFLRHLFDFGHDIVEDIKRTQDMNALMENDKALRDIFETFVNENPNLSPEELHMKNPYQIREFRFPTNTTEREKKEFEIAVKSAGIPCKFFTSVEKPYGKFTYSYLLTPGDAQTREDLDKIVKEFFQEHKKIFDNLASVARIKLEDLEKENIGGALTQFEDLTASQVEWFENIAQDEGFHFAAEINETGLYTVSVSKVTAEYIPLEAHIAAMKSIQGFVIKECQDFNSERAAYCAKLGDETLKGKRNEDLYFVQNTFNTNYALKIVPDGSFEFYKNGTLVDSGKANGDNKKEIQSKIQSCFTRMEQPLLTTEENFAKFKSSKTFTPNLATILQKPLELPSYTSQQKYGRMLNVLDYVAQKNGSNFDISEKISLTMEKLIKSNKEIDRTTQTALLHTLSNMTMSPEQIQEMFSSSDSLNVFGITNPTLATEFNHYFDAAARTTALEALKIETQLSQLVKQEIENIGIASFTHDLKSFDFFVSKEFFEHAFSKLYTKDVESMGILSAQDVSFIVTSYCENIRNEFISTEPKFKVVDRGLDFEDPDTPDINSHEDPIAPTDPR